MTTRLYRSKTDSVISGVCGGLARYLGLDAMWVRLFFVFLALGDGIGLLLYLILWLVMPLEGRDPAAPIDENIRATVQEFTTAGQNLGADLPQTARWPDRTVGIVVGAALIVLGTLYFVSSLNIPWLWWLSFDVLWPLLLVVGGIVVLARALRGAA